MTIDSVTRQVFHSLSNCHPLAQSPFMFVGDINCRGCQMVIPDVTLAMAQPQCTDENHEPRALGGDLLPRIGKGEGAHGV